MTTMLQILQIVAALCQQPGSGSSGQQNHIHQAYCHSFYAQCLDTPRYGAPRTTSLPWTPDRLTHCMVESTYGSEVHY